MCWNASVSLNTFLFSLFVIILAYIHNYSTKSLLLFLSIILIQLDEFFLWTYLDNKTLNMYFSIIGLAIISIQPLAAIMILSKSHNRDVLLFLYLIFILSCIYFVLQQDWEKFFTTSVANNKHLYWHWLPESIFFLLMYLFLLTAPFYLSKIHYGFIFAVTTLLISIYYYFTEHTFGSMWCWFTNAYAFYLLTKIIFLYFPR